jgi:hypothetical protein
MIDLVGAIAGTATYATIVGVLVGYSSVGRAAKLRACAAAAAWGALVVALAALGAFAPGIAGPVPTPVLAFVASLAVLLGSWVRQPGFRSALLSVPLPALIGLNIARLGGVFFLVLAAGGRLSAPFAPVAGAGDMLVGAAAIPLAAIALRGGTEPPRGLGLWNALGALDLVLAIALGGLSAPGAPFRVFTEGPGALAMGTLPWIVVPALLVPLYLLIHLAIAARLRRGERVSEALATAR